MTLSLHLVDLVVLVAYLSAVVLFGVWIGRGAKSMSAYLLGNRHLPWWAILGSIVATETSTATFLSVPGLAPCKPGPNRLLMRCHKLWVKYFGRRFNVNSLKRSDFGKTRKRTLPRR